MQQRAPTLLRIATDARSLLGANNALGTTPTWLTPSRRCQDTRTLSSDGSTRFRGHGCARESEPGLGPAPTQT